MGEQNYGRDDMGLNLLRILYLHLKKTSKQKTGKTQTYHLKEPTDKLSRCLQSAIEIVFSKYVSASCAKHFRNLANYLDS